VATARTGDETLAPPSPSVGLTYQPALDGVRGIAVLLVVVFHLDVGILGGGYLGVSVFFTLSGFLITSLLLSEARIGALDSARSSGDRSSSGIDLPRFYVRRVKRLLPASTATLLAVVVLAAVGLIERTSTLQGDVTAAAWNVFNWRELASGNSYAELFESESPVAHFWSLAIEEQFYVFWPVVLVVLLKAVGSRRSGLLAALSLLFAASTISALVASADVVYFATWTRAAEILAGAILATWMWKGPATASTKPGSANRPNWWSKLTAPALGIIVLASVVTPTSSGWAYAGGLPLFSIASVALIAGLQAPGRVRKSLSLVPIVALGRVSYGVYLVHWPVFIVLDEQRLGTGGWTLASARLATTLLIAGVMYIALERPIRTSSRIIPPIAVAGMALGAIVAVTIAAATVSSSSIASDPAPAVIGAPVDSVLAPTTVRPSGPDEDRAATTSSLPSTATSSPSDNSPSNVAAGSSNDTNAGEVELSDAPLAATDATLDTLVAVPLDVPVAEATLPPAAVDIPVEQGPVSVAVFGDSIPAWLLRDAAASYERTDAVLLNGALEGCDGMVDLPRGRDRRQTEMVVPDDCLDWTVSYPSVLSGGPAAEIGLLMIGQAPVVDRLVDERWQGPCESLDWYLDDVVARVEFLQGADIEPVLALPARYGEGVTYVVTDDHLERIQCIRTALRDTAIGLDVQWFDLDDFLCPDDQCDVRRTADGVHVDADVAPVVLNEVLDQVLAINPRALSGG